MRVLVTGAAGFIGQHVMEELVEANHEVIGLDAREPGDARCAYFVPADITRPLDPIPGLDAVIHLAAMANPRECDANPQAAFNVNVNGTNQVLRMALKSGARKVVFSSTAHVYGISPRYMPTPESHELWLQNPYTLTKILGEQLCRLYFDNHGLGYTALRLFNAYGPGQLPGYFVPDITAKAKAGAIDLQGSNVTKDWVYIDDVAQAFVRAVESVFVGPINIGTGIETDLGSIARTVAEAFKAKLTCSPIEDATRMKADIRRAQSILGWSPEVQLVDGLRRILQVPVGAIA